MTGTPRGTPVRTLPSRQCSEELADGSGPAKTTKMIGLPSNVRLPRTVAETTKLPHETSLGLLAEDHRLLQLFLDPGALPAPEDDLQDIERGRVTALSQIVNGDTEVTL